MPVYQYRCPQCNHEFETVHGINDEKPECPECEFEDVKRLIVDAPAHARGVLTHAGDGYRATREQLRAKWQEETPRLRKKMRDKLGEEAVKKIPTLNMDID